MLSILAVVLGTTQVVDAPSINLVNANEWNFVSICNSDFTRVEKDGLVQYYVRVSARKFSEAVPSWSARTENGSKLNFYVKPIIAAAKEFSLGTWAIDATDELERTSVNEQEDEYSKVITDTWILKQPITEFFVRIDATPGKDGTFPTLSQLNFILSGEEGLSKPDQLPLTDLLLDVPLRAQMSYENGGVLCSPTSVSMILGYWAKRMESPFLDKDVPEVQKGVYDPGWKGTGNWPFNVAFAAAQPGMTGYVTRLRSVSDIEAFVAHGVPVATSVSYGHLKGVGKQDNDGHIVVIVGFDKDGTPIFNDPGRNQVRMTYKRTDFEKAWATSKNTVYIIHPKGWKTPQNGPWPSKKIETFQ